MTDIFREVDEEVRRDKATEFWAKHGSKIIAGAVVIVLAVGGWRMYQNYQLRERQDMGARFAAALVEAEAGKPEAQASLTAIANGKSSTYATLARFRLAAELARTAKDEAGLKNAASAFEALGADGALAPEWREIAQLRAALVLVDSAPLDEIEKRLAPLAQAGKPFRHSAREGIALAAYRTKAFDKALTTLEQIVLDSETPAGLRQRAELLLAVVRSGPVN